MCEGRRKRVLGEEAPARAGGGHRRFPQGWCPQQGQPPPPRSASDLAHCRRIFSQPSTEAPLHSHDSS